jgi:hypothetical protein
MIFEMSGGSEVSLSLPSEFRVEASDALLTRLERHFGRQVAELTRNSSQSTVYR